MNTLIKQLLRENLLKELSISDVSLNDFNVKEIIDGWLMSSTETPVMLFKYEMQDDYDLTPEEKEELMDADEDEILDTDRFKNWLKYEAEYRIDEFIRMIGGYLNEDDTITIWREMTVSDEWISKLPTSGNRLGMFWSYDKDSAEAHWGGGESKRVLIQTSVKENYIDWNQTINANINLQLGEEEKEITLFKNTPIKIEALSVNGESIDVRPISDKVFKA